MKTIYNTPTFEYQPKTSKQLKASYDDRNRKGTNSFLSFEDYTNWYNSQPKICHYCGLTELQSQEIVVKGLLTSNRFPQNGRTGRGKGRGMWLEVDRIHPKKPYSEGNCVLACYFCNNDKSDVFSGDDYKLFFQNRKEFLERLLAR